MMEYHPNRLPFEGCLAYVDVPSDGAPSGARGHQICVTRQAAAESLHTLIGMALNVSPCLTTHSVRQKCGVISWAELDGARIMVGGYIFGRDFPELEAQLPTFGMSYEIQDAHVVDMRDSVWHLSKLTFVGAAILLRDKASYRKTFIRVAPPVVSIAASAIHASGWIHEIKGVDRSESTDGRCMVQCYECRREFDEDDMPTHKVNGNTVCRECVESCHDCGTWLDDESTELGPTVLVRRWEREGKVQVSHALCAAEDLLGVWSGSRINFELETVTREDVAGIVAAAFYEPKEAA